MGVSQPAHFGEDWSDERVKGYLDKQPPLGESADFYALLTAYKHMRAYDFARFVVFFQAAQRDLNAIGPDGMSLLAWMRSHTMATEFIAILESANSV